MIAAKSALGTRFHSTERTAVSRVWVHLWKAQDGHSAKRLMTMAELSSSIYHATTSSRSLEYLNWFLPAPTAISWGFSWKRSRKRKIRVQETLTNSKCTPYLASSNPNSVRTKRSSILNRPITWRIYKNHPMSADSTGQAGHPTATSSSTRNRSRRSMNLFAPRSTNIDNTARIR